MTAGEAVRRRPASVLVVGATVPEVRPWLRALGHATVAVPTAAAARRAIAGAPPDLVVADDERGGLDVPAVCGALRADARLGEAWILAITDPSEGRRADAALRAGADDFLHRPFTRGELLARARAGLRAARQRSDDRLVQALLLNVPGAIYRTACHDGHKVEIVSDAIEQIVGLPSSNFVTSARRTLHSVVHPEDRERVEEAVDRQAAFALEYRIVRPDGDVRWVLDRGQFVRGAGEQLWLDGAIFDITERRAAEAALRRREIEDVRTEELRASRVRIVQAADAARRRIERDLHDGAQQRLVALALEVRLARSRVDAEPALAAPVLEHVGEELSEASAELRELARGIHPAVLTERGLGAALTALAGRAPVPVEVLEVPGDRLAAALETTAYFTVAEALTNVAKYAQATHASVSAVVEDAALVVEVRDDGVGGARASAGSGLSGLDDRVAACDGTLEVESPRGHGTTLRAVLPLA